MIYLMFLGSLGWVRYYVGFDWRKRREFGVGSWWCVFGCWGLWGRGWIVYGKIRYMRFEMMVRSVCMG